MEPEPFTFQTMEGWAGQTLDRLFKVKSSFLQIQPSGYIYPTHFVFEAAKIRDMEVYSDDIWLASYPRTGSNWAQEMLFCILHDFDYEKAKIPLVIRNPLLESSSLMAVSKYVDAFAEQGNSVDVVKNLSRPREIKTHLPWELLPKDLSKKKPKIFYIARNPKDTCVSLYHFCKLMHDVNGTFEDFAELIVTDNGPLCPYWNHILSYWSRRNDENIFFFTYEEMKKNLPTMIKRVVKFLDKKVSEEQISGLFDHLQFSKMAENPAINLSPILSDEDNNHPDSKFIRKGKIGDWRNYMSDELSKRFDEWTERNLKGTGLVFDES